MSAAAPAQLTTHALLAMSVLLFACDAPVTQGPRFAALTPQPAVQDGMLTLYGEGFGEHEPTHSAVFINGVCADVLAWTPDQVDVQIPTGVGVGARTVALVRADGIRANTTVALSGDDLPARPRLCETLLEPTLFDVTDAPSEDQVADLDLDTVVDVAGSPGWRYVRIQDTSGNGLGRNPGADIDAIVLNRTDGSVAYAEDVTDYLAVPMTPELDDPYEALGGPDAFPDFPDLGVCDIYEGTVALGGAGYLVVRMGAAMGPGDQLEIYERGGCFYAPNLTSIAESFVVSIGRATDEPLPDGIEWIEVGAGEGPMVGIELE